MHITIPMDLHFHIKFYGSGGSVNFKVPKYLQTSLSYSNRFPYRSDRRLPFVCFVFVFLKGSYRLFYCRSLSLPLLIAYLNGPCSILRGVLGHIRPMLDNILVRSRACTLPVCTILCSCRMQVIYGV
jgi:hypothetical protein